MLRIDGDEFLALSSGNGSSGQQTFRFEALPNFSEQVAMRAGLCLE